MGFWKKLTYPFREYGAKYSRKDFSESATSLAKANRCYGIICGLQDKVRERGEMSESIAERICVTAEMGLESIQIYEAKIDEDMRKRIDQEMGGGDLSVHEMKERFEYLVRSLKPLSVKN